MIHQYYLFHFNDRRKESIDKIDCIEWASKFRVLPGREHQFFLVLDAILKQACSKVDVDPNIEKEFPKIISVLEEPRTCKNTLYSAKFRLCLIILNRFLITRVFVNGNKENVKLWLTPSEPPSSQEYINSQLKSFFGGIVDTGEYIELSKSVAETICFDAKKFIASPEHTLKWCVEFLHSLVQNAYDGYVYKFL